jgi:hypothetical protein
VTRAETVCRCDGIDALRGPWRPACSAQTCERKARRMNRDIVKWVLIVIGIPILCTVALKLFVAPLLD